jgi:hypothetical protein
MSSLHVYPSDDWIEHDTSGLDCPCEPRVEWWDEDGNHYAVPLVIHNALDGRDE